jgi:transposase InsO family protein
LYVWIAKNQDVSSIALCCAAFGVRREGYYPWQKRPSRRERDEALVSALKKVRDEHPVYGVRSMLETLPEMLKPSYGKGYSICRAYGLLQKRRKPHTITKINPKAQPAEDLVKGDFKSKIPNTKWLTDVTEMKCKDGKLYLCAVLDCFDASIVGFSMDINMKTLLCTSALNSAVKRYGKTGGLIVHSDRGSQFTSHLFRETLANKGLRQSMGRAGNCFNNARIKSFFATLKKELIYRLPGDKMNRAESFGSVSLNGLKAVTMLVAPAFLFACLHPLIWLETP